MAHADAKSVKGDFNDATFDYFGARSRFFRKNGDFVVETDGADGKLASFKIAYVFGVEPLQQYLVAFPDGRLQALPFAWDSRAKDAGGQRWLHLYPKEKIVAGDELHWTKLNQNWNFMCAGCHSTGLRKNYDAANDRFATTWTDVNVACEACHGPGAAHVAWAKAGGGGSDDRLAVRFDERAGATWTRAGDSSSPARSTAPGALRKEVETCGLCHARASVVSEDWIPGRPLSDTHVVTPIEPRLYTPDGQMVDIEETYNYVPFKQSRMFAAGVTCGDCHDPHSAKLRLPGDAACLACHAPVLATPAHTHHAKSEGAPGCAACHMPTRTYMTVDRRHDHSFRIPRPDLSVSLGVPNACNDCHADKPPQWAAAAVDQWFGPKRKGFQTYARAFHDAWGGVAGSAALLANVAGDAGAPAVARASALGALAGGLDASAFSAAQQGLKADDPMVRIGALDALESLPPEQLAPLAAPLLSDPALAVRLRAVSAVARAPKGALPQDAAAAFERAGAEFVAAQRLNADRPEARTDLGAFYASTGKPDLAAAEFEAALRLDPAFTPAAVDLADLSARRGDPAKAGDVLRKAIAAVPGDAAAHHALGLELVRERKTEEAIRELKRAAELEPDAPRYAYVYAAALNSAGRPKEAIAAVQGALARHPDDEALLSAGLAFARDSGDYQAALAFADRLAQLNPADANLARIVEALKARAGKP